MFKNAGQLTENDKKSSFAPFKKGHYILEVKEATMGETEEKEWKNRLPIPTGRMVPQMTIIFNLLKEDGGTEIENEDGVMLVNPTYRFWVNDTNLGWDKKDKQPKKGRELLAALLGVKNDADISAGFDTENLVGKAIKAYLTVAVDDKQNRKNVIMDPENYSKKK